METTRTFLRIASRALQEEFGDATDAIDNDIDTAAADMTTSTTTNTSDDDDNFDPVVFWGVNAFLGVMLLVACGCCVVCGKNNHWNYWLTITNMHERRRQTDVDYQRQLRQQNETQEARKVDTPAVRKQKLLQSFQRHHVSMVRYVM